MCAQIGTKACVGPFIFLKFDLHGEYGVSLSDFKCDLCGSQYDLDGVILFEGKQTSVDVVFRSAV